MTEQDSRSADQFTGVSTASFLQMLEQERKSCVFVIEVGGRTGRLYFEHGELVDAEFHKDEGLDAVYALLALEGTSIRLDPPERRGRTIHTPLAHILLNAAKMEDEQRHEEKVRKSRQSTIERLIGTIRSTAGVHQYYLLDRQGRMLACSYDNHEVADFLTFVVISGVQAGKALDAKGPHQIQLVLQGGEVLLILPGAGMIIGLLLSHHASVEKIIARLRQTLAGP